MCPQDMGYSKGDISPRPLLGGAVGNITLKNETLPSSLLTKVCHFKEKGQKEKINKMNVNLMHKYMRRLKRLDEAQYELVGVPLSIPKNANDSIQITTFPWLVLIPSSNN